MANNLPDNFKDPADDEDIHEFAEMPYIDFESEDDYLRNTDTYPNDSIPDETFAIILALNSQEIIEPQWKIDYYKSQEKWKAQSKSYQSVMHMWYGSPEAFEAFNNHIEQIKKWKL